MIWAIRQLLVPVRYVRIRHGTGLFRSKYMYDFILPAVLTLATCAIFWYLDLRLAIFEYAELVKGLRELLTLMIVFYMAALAAVATFDRKGIDDPLKGEDATLQVQHHDGGHYVTKVLTYRQFISYLFGYLSFLSLCLYIFIVMFSVIWPEFEKLVKYNSSMYLLLTKWADPLIFFIVFFAVWQLTITSLLGIYFLTERIQSLYDPDS